MAQIGAGMSDGSAYIDDSADPQLIRFWGTSAGPLQLSLDSYVFLPDLARGSDSNFFTANYPMLVLWSTVALVFSLEQDQASQQASAVYEGRARAEFTRCSADDAAREVRGRHYRMGGV